MEALHDREDLSAVAQEVQDLQERWKQARQAPKEQAEPLWLRFKTARDQVKVKVEAQVAEQEAAQAQNLEKKQTLCGQAEALQDSTEWVKTAAELQRWWEWNPGSRRQDAELTKRFRRACHHFFERRKTDLAQRKEDWSKSLGTKQALIAQVEALQESTAWDQAVADVKRLQAEWKATGPVRRSQSEALWQRFRAACDVIFDRYKKRDELTLAAQHQQREALLAGMEGLASTNGSETPDLAGRVQALLADWRRLPELPPGKGRAVLEPPPRPRRLVVRPAASRGPTSIPANRPCYKLFRQLARRRVGGGLVTRQPPKGGARPTPWAVGRSRRARWQTVARDLR